MERADVNNLPKRPALPWLLLLFLVCQLISAANATTELLRVRAAGKDDRVRLVLDLSSETTYRQRVLTDPHRIAIDLRGTTAPHLELPELDDWMVKRVRFNQLSGPTAQIVFDLAQAAHFNVFALEASGDKPVRVVCDIYRRKERSSGPPEGPWVVVIDPGHGGRDPGTVSQQFNLTESAVVLDVAQRLKRVLDQEAGISVRLTREENVTLGLRDRVDRARSLGGDVFVSIHVNGCPARSACGAEVFYLSLEGATDVASRELEALENAADVTDDPLLGEMAGFPFAVDLIQTDTITRSSLLAEVILDALGESRLAAKRSVRQANFVVLRSSRVPSALIELGFISNIQDASRLATATHRQALAETIARGLLEFRREYARLKG